MVKEVMLMFDNSIENVIRISFYIVDEMLVSFWLVPMFDGLAMFLFFFYNHYCRI